MTEAVKITPLTADEACELAAKALEQWPGTHGTPQLVMHRENTVFRVRIGSGDAALRIHRAGYHDRNAIESELGWMAHLASEGIPVPAPLASKAGELTVALQTGHHAPRIIDMLTWLVGEPLGRSGMPLLRPPEQNVRIFSELGRAMAQFHISCDNWKMPENFSRHSWDMDGLVGERPFWGAFWDMSGLTPDEREVLITFRDKARTELDFLQSAGAAYGLIHADLVRENVLVSGDAIRMIDFDDAGFGFRMFDIATALFKNRNEPNFVALQKSLIDGYLKIRPALRTEIDTLPLFMALRALTYLGWAEQRTDEPGMDARRERYKADALALVRDYLQQQF